ncbi:MAG TPA: GMC family oxidoreductase N-terminal domain-containing protein, partial [Gemmatimonadales bacterium]
MSLETLRAVVETLVPDGAGVGLAERVAQQVARLPRAADQAELLQLLGLMQNRIANVVLGGVATPFTALDRLARERYLRGWATSRLPAKRKAFQALKRLTTVAYYTAVDERGRNPSWAALGYPGPIEPAPQVAKPIRPLAVAGDTVLDCDVVVVGSGAGGGVVAGELAAQGKDVVVLEKGAYLNESDFSQLEGDMLQRAYDGGGLLATDDLSAIILQGSCLGGGTVVNYTTSFHTPDNVREEWAREHGLPHFTSAEYTRSLDAVAQRIHVTTGAARPSARDAILIRGLERCGWHHGLLPRDVDGCTQDDTCGYCGYGCRRGAKQSTLLTYLQDAHAKGARIVTQASVRRVTFTQGRATGVEALVQPPGAHRAYALTVRARAVVVACGSIHSPALLLRSGIALPAL